jgi:hypothetical protein
MAKKATVLWDSVGYKPFPDATEREDRRATQYAIRGDEIDLEDSEHKRLSELGAVGSAKDAEGTSRDDAVGEAARAGLPEVTTPGGKSPDEPTDPSGPGAVGTPLDQEVEEDPRVGSASGTKRETDASKRTSGARDK